MSILERIHYIDIAKGILITLVLAHHSVGIFGSESIISCLVINSQSFYVPFFMPAFFFITGFCSNFNKDFSRFLVDNIRTLIVPCFILRLIVFIYEGHGNIWIYCLDFISNGTLWFVSSLFLSKIVYWFLRKYCNHFLLFIMLLFPFLAKILFSANMPNHWNIINALDLILYLYLGQLYRRHEPSIKVKVALMSIYLICTILYLQLYNRVPTNTAIYNIKYYYDILPHIFISLGGTIACLEFSKVINCNKILEYIGKSSLVIFIVQPSIIPRIEGICHRNLVFDQYGIIQLMAYIVIIVGTLLFGAILNAILNTKYFCWLLGKKNMVQIKK